MVINDRKGNTLFKSVSAISESLRQVLSHYKKVPLVAPWRKPSGVLLPLYVKENRHVLVLTRRSLLVHHHKGEISFPGGSYHQSDGNLRQTALRESFEEIGINPDQVDILGELDDVATLVSSFNITPFVGLIPPDSQYKLSDFEIRELIHIPVEALLNEDCRQTGPVELQDGREVITYNYTYQDKQVVGATGRILKQFLDIYLQAAELVT